jgi:hypothetical protein
MTLPFIFFSFDSPHYLRQKTGLGEAWGVAIFKANRGQKLPLTKYIKALPDIMFFIVSLSISRCHLDLNLSFTTCLELLANVPSLLIGSHE